MLVGSVPEAEDIARFEPRITRALKALAEAGKPVTFGTLRELGEPPTFERQPQMVDDPGTSVNDCGADEVLW
ncbi:hypothetical protein ACH4Y0_02250 [Streptomyces sp. NPDC020707]|uniref:hypothetical protein n=1 Tax=Streptomyces sp. NPDC020707 TaxID=3365084 RepID=UPI003798B8E4